MFSIGDSLILQFPMDRSVLLPGELLTLIQFKARREN